MRRWLRSILPKRIGGQLLLLVVVAVVLTQALNFGVLFVSDQGRREETKLRVGLGMFISGVRMIAASPASDWPSIADIVRTTQPNIDFSYAANATWSGPDADEGSTLGFIARDLGPGFAVKESPAPDGSSTGQRLVAVQLPNGVVVSAKLSIPNMLARTL